MQHATEIKQIRAAHSQPVVQVSRVKGINKVISTFVFISNVLKMYVKCEKAHLLRTKQRNRGNEWGGISGFNWNKWDFLLLERGGLLLLLLLLLLRDLRAYLAKSWYSWWPSLFLGMLPTKSRWLLCEMVTPTFRSLRISHPFNCHNPTNEYVRFCDSNLQHGFDIERSSRDDKLKIKMEKDATKMLLKADLGYQLLSNTRGGRSREKKKCRIEEIEPAGEEK